MLSRRGFLGAVTALVAVPRRWCVSEPLTTLRLSDIAIPDLSKPVIAGTPIGTLIGTYVAGSGAINLPGAWDDVAANDDDYPPITTLPE